MRRVSSSSAPARVSKDQPSPRRTIGIGSGQFAGQPGREYTGRVREILPAEADELLAMEVVREGMDVLVATDGGFAYETSRLLDWAEDRSGGFFAAAELALVSLREAQIQRLAEQPGRRGRRGRRLRLVAEHAVLPQRRLEQQSVADAVLGDVRDAGLATPARPSTAARCTS